MVVDDFSRNLPGLHFFSPYNEYFRQSVHSRQVWDGDISAALCTSSLIRSQTDVEEILKGLIK